MFEQMIADRHAELSGQAKNEQRARDTAAQLAPLIDQQLAPLLALSDYTVRQCGGEIRVCFSRKANPLNPAPSLVVKVFCPTERGTAVAAFVVIDRHPDRTEETPISFSADTPPETIVQDVLASCCAADFQRLIALWVR